MSKGVLISQGDNTTALLTTYQAIPLSSNTALDNACFSPAPTAMHLWVLTVDLTAVSTSATVTVILTYDSGGTKTCAGPSSASSIANPTGTRGCASIYINAPCLWPNGTTKGTLYAWIKVDAGTPTLATKGLRLVYTDMAGT